VSLGADPFLRFQIEAFALISGSDVSGGSKGMIAGVFLPLRNKQSTTTTAIAHTAPPMIPPTTAGVLDFREDTTAGRAEGEGVAERDEGPGNMVGVDVTTEVGEATKAGLC